MLATTFILALCVASMSKAPENIKEEFEQKYRVWREYISSHPEFRLLSIAGPQFECPQFKEIVKVGPPVLPYVVQKIEENPNEQLLWKAIEEIAKVKILAEYDKAKRMAVFPDFPNVTPGEEVYVYWWKTARKETPKRFEMLNAEWEELKNEGKEDEAKEKYKEIRHLGIAALPMMMDKVGEGDRELVAVVSELTAGKVDPNASIPQCVSWWEQNKEDWLIPFPNKQPKAKAGKDTIAKSGDLVTLDGSASSDADKDILTYKWTQIAGPSVTLSDNTAVKPTFTAPVVQQQTVLTFQLMVNDGSPKKSVHPSCESGESDPNTVNITVKPKG